jgi:hypothetical protein
MIVLHRFPSHAGPAEATVSKLDTMPHRNATRRPLQPPRLLAILADATQP